MDNKELEYCKLIKSHLYEITFVIKTLLGNEVAKNKGVITPDKIYDIINRVYNKHEKRIDAYIQSEIEYENSDEEGVIN